MKAMNILNLLGKKATLPAPGQALPGRSEPVATAEVGGAPEGRAERGSVLGRDGPAASDGIGDCQAARLNAPPVNQSCGTTPFSPR